MEVKIGVIHASRELTLETSHTVEEIQQAVSEAFSGERGIFELRDDRGRSVHVPADKLAYVEISDESTRRVGFGASTG